MVRSTLVAAAFALAAGTAGAQNVDIVGLRLGMTESEAIAALKAHDPTLKIVSRQSTFVYTDGIKQFSTEPFLSRIDAARPKSQLPVANFILSFTPPPNGGKLWAIERRDRIDTNKPTQQQYTEALVQKYGKPTATSRNGAALAWDLPAGRQSCLRNPSDPGFPMFRPSNTTSPLMTTLEYQQRGKRAPADLTQCASQLHYVLGTLSGHVIDEFQAYLIDVPGYVAATRAANQRVDALEQQVRKAREGKGKAPVL
jgi:hypothetical protein